MNRLRILCVATFFILSSLLISGMAFASGHQKEELPVPQSISEDISIDQAQTKPEREPRLFLLSPSAGWYFPTDSKTKDTFGNTWTAFGVSLNLGALKGTEMIVRTGGFELRPFFGYISQEHNNNDIKIIPIGLESRWQLYKNDNFRFYSGLGLSVNFVKFDIPSENIDISWRGALGGRVLLGADVTKWLNIQATYNIVDTVECYDFDGFHLRARINLYF